jgi:hypothetical protein
LLRCCAREFGRVPIVSCCSRCGSRGYWTKLKEEPATVRCGIMVHSLTYRWKSIIYDIRPYVGSKVLSVIFCIPSIFCPVVKICFASV